MSQNRPSHPSGPSQLKSALLALLVGGLAMSAATLSPLASAGLFDRKKEPELIAIDPAGDVSKIAAALKVSGAKPGAKKVVVGRYQVVIINESAATAFASGRAASNYDAGSGSARQTVVWHLVNLDPAKLAELADRSYDSFQKALVAQGFEVLPYASVSALPEAIGIAGDPKLQRVQMVDLGKSPALMVTPSALPVRVPFGLSATSEAQRSAESTAATAQDAGKLAAAAGKGGALGSLLGGNSSLGGVLEAGKIISQGGTMIADATAYGKIASALDAHIVDVVIALDFVNLSASKEGLLDRLSGGTKEAKVASKISPTVVSGTTTLRTIGPGGTGGGLMLEAPLLMAGDAVSETRDANTTADKVSNVTNIALVGALALSGRGGGGVSQISRKEAVASPAYADVVAQNLEAVHRAFALALK